MVSSVFADSRAGEPPAVLIVFLYPAFNFSSIRFIFTLQVTVSHDSLTDLSQQSLKPALILLFSSGLKYTQRQDLLCLRGAGNEVEYFPD